MRILYLFFVFCSCFPLYADNLPCSNETKSDLRKIICEKQVFFKIGKINVFHFINDKYFFFKSGMYIDADGAPDAYNPKNSGTDHLENAGKPGNWWGIATDKNGRPYIQNENDPNPGYYVSTTALIDPSKSRNDPERYVNSNEIAYFVLPIRKTAGAKPGDIAVVINTKNDKHAFAIFADFGPKNHIGEGSICLAKMLGIPSNPRKGGISNGILYIVFPGSGNGKPMTLDKINSIGKKHFKKWGGFEKVKQCKLPEG